MQRSYAKTPDPFPHNLLTEEHSAKELLLSCIFTGQHPFELHSRDREIYDGPLLSDDFIHGQPVPRLAASECKPCCFPRGHW
jgi:hypothetical protein